MTFSRQFRDWVEALQRLSLESRPYTDCAWTQLEADVGADPLLWPMAYFNAPEFFYVPPRNSVSVVDRGWVFARLPLTFCFPRYLVLAGRLMSDPVVGRWVQWRVLGHWTNDVWGRMMDEYCKTGEPIRLIRSKLEKQHCLSARLFVPVGRQAGQVKYRRITTPTSIWYLWSVDGELETGLGVVQVRTGRWSSVQGYVLVTGALYQGQRCWSMQVPHGVTYLRAPAAEKFRERVCKWSPVHKVFFPLAYKSKRGKLRGSAEDNASRHLYWRPVSADDMPLIFPAENFVRLVWKGIWQDDIVSKWPAVLL